MTSVARLDAEQGRPDCSKGDDAELARTRSSFLIVPGLNDSDAGHWQTRWQRDYGLPRVVQPQWNVPDIDVWAQTLERYVGVFASPVVLLAHSFGCLTTAFAAARLRNRIAAALLVAPPDPNKFGIAARLPASCLPFPSIMVGSRNDPWMDIDWAQWWAGSWGSVFIDIGAAGHINTASGFGEWPRGWELAQVLALQQKLQ